MNDQRLLFNILSLFQIVFLMFQGDALAQDEAYHIGSRDVLSLTIHAGGDMQQGADLTVNADGMINVPFVGSVRAEGLTISQLENRIFEPLARDYFVNPQINIHIKEYHSLRYYIAGAVAAPGLYETRSKATLMTLIAKAGGVSPDRGELAYVLRDAAEQIVGGHEVTNLLSHSKSKKIDLNGLLDKADMSHNLLLRSGDVVYIPFKKEEEKTEHKIYVEGEIRNPGAYEYQPKMTALNACIMAGGFTRFAAPHRTRIIRRVNGGQRVINIDLNQVKQGLIPDLELKPEDMINVPETWL